MASTIAYSHVVDAALILARPYGEDKSFTGTGVDPTWHVATLFEVCVLPSDMRIDGVPMSWRQPARPPGSASARADISLDSNSTLSPRNVVDSS
jgi:hypothetical protein